MRASTLMRGTALLGVAYAVTNSNPKPSYPNIQSTSFASLPSSLTSSSSFVQGPMISSPFSSLIQQLQFGSSSTPPPPSSHSKGLWLVGTAVAVLNGAKVLLSTPAFSFSLRPATPATRMKERLERHGFVEKPVEPDGNCQMRAISDQLYGDENRHKDVRSKITEWLKSNEKYTVDNSGTAFLGDFIDRDQFPTWMSYVSYMARNGTWGDHITLLGAAETFATRITILSNIDDGGTGQYVTLITPRLAKADKNIYLSHWHEMHYNSLYMTKPPDAQQAA